MDGRMPRLDPNGLASGQGASETNVDLARIVAFVKASRRTVICWTITGLVVALVYALTAVPEYTATADLILDARKIQVFKDAPVVGDDAIDAAQIESQVEILRSEALATSVVKQLKLIFYSANSQAIERTFKSALEKRLGTTFRMIS
jgi:uncharacterized protein involved in exopolysaccharide biosynthesis